LEILNYTLYRPGNNLSAADRHEIYLAQENLLEGAEEQAVWPEEAIKFVELNSFFTFLLPQSGHETGPLSVAKTIFSKEREHFSHIYSYKGIITSPDLTGFYIGIGLYTFHSKGLVIE